MKYYSSFIIFLFSALLIGSAEDYITNINISMNRIEFKDAEAKFKQALKEYDANAALYFTGAQISMKLDDLDQANKYFVKAIELDSENEDYRNAQKNVENLKNGLTAARKTFDSGLMDDAINEYEKLTEKYSENAIIFYNMGLIYKANKEYDLAVQNYKNASNLNPFEEKYAKAIKAISQLIAKEGDTEFRRQEFDVAIEKYKKAIVYYPEYTIAIFKLARTYYKLKDYDNARLNLRKGLSINPKQEQVEKMLGDIYRKTEDFEKSLEHYNNAIAINSNYFQAYYSLGSLHILEGRFDEARDALNNAILLEPTYSKAYGALGTVEQELGNINDAIQNYIQAVEYDPKAYDIHYRLSSAYNINMQFDNAKTSAKNSLYVKRNYAPAHFELGIAEKSLGNKIAAKDAFEKAKKDRNWRKSAQYELDLISKGL